MEKPTHLCTLAIDPRDPSAIIQSQADRIEELESYIDRLKRVIAEASTEVETYPDWCKVLLNQTEQQPK